ncbi:hypothetical protein [Pseudomonas aeruginosa]|uniref:hypothetical protein n=1 Tax=Pseudomonas aeruginosa TaxID=287 RepID=UPI000A952C27|nr:hypothetical protein [Pseudomonas aeruginosa]MCR3842857.1 hypothetical protein [Pseudomonas aeruginosa]MCT0536597.1 hypothetical protein [Pseudomonas aeruginosa]MCT0548950.1 hypothetical protein [Pseudomonas aeruginosa]
MKFRVSFTAALLAAGLPLMSLQAAPLQAVPAVQAGKGSCRDKGKIHSFGM